MNANEGLDADQGATRTGAELTFLVNEHRKRSRNADIRQPFIRIILPMEQLGT